MAKELRKSSFKNKRNFILAISCKFLYIEIPMESDVGTNFPFCPIEPGQENKCDGAEDDLKASDRILDRIKSQQFGRQTIL
jgi:hypothetical protein